MRERLGELDIEMDLDVGPTAVVANVLRVAGAVRGHLERTVLADVDLSFTAFTVLWVLWIWGEQEPRELAADAGVTKGTLSGVVGTLEGRGLVVRRRDPADGRLVHVSATAAGRDPGDITAPPVPRRRAPSGRRAHAAESTQLAHLLGKLLHPIECVPDQQPAAGRTRS